MTSRTPESAVQILDDGLSQAVDLGDALRRDAVLGVALQVLELDLYGHQQLEWTIMEALGHGTRHVGLRSRCGLRSVQGSGPPPGGPARCWVDRPLYATTAPR